MKASKHVFKSVLWIFIFGIVFSLYIIFAVPLVSNNKGPAKVEELLAHNETLEAIRADFSCAATYDNVDMDILGKNINLTISGEVCDLKVTLNKELEIIDIESVEKEGDEIIFALMSLAIILLLMFTVYFTISNIYKAADIIRENKKAKKVVKDERAPKKSSKSQGDNVLV